MEESIKTLIGRHRAMALSTYGKALSTLEIEQANFPWITPVYYVFKPWQFYFLSSSSSLHAQNLADNPYCSAAIFDEPEDYKKIKGLQMAGIVRQIEKSAEKALIMANFASRFSFLGGFVRDDRLHQALVNNQLYSFQPSSICLVDNESQGFGNRQWFQPYKAKGR